MSTPGDGGVADGANGVGGEIDALRARIDTAKAAAEVRAKAITAGTPPPVGRADPGGRGPDHRGLRRGLILLLLLVLLGAGATILSRNRGSEDQDAGPRDSTTVTSAGGRTPQVTTVPTTAAPGPTSPKPPATTPGGTTPTASPTPHGSPPAAATTVVVAVGDSFWTIATRTVSARGGTPTKADVGRYWARVVDANRSQLAHPGNPNLIYPGQTFSLP